MRAAAPRVDGRQRQALERRRERLSSPAFIAELLRRHAGVRACSVGSALQDESPDRFVLRVEADAGAQPAAYAFKVYADDRGARLWRIAQALAAHGARVGGATPLCLPLAHVPELGLTIYPWIEGTALREGIRRGDAALLGKAAEAAAGALAWVHRAQLPAEPSRGPEAAIERAHRRCAKFSGSAEGDSLVRPLLAALESARPLLERSPVAFVHGDPGPANLLLEDGRWRLIDLDRCGHADPASDLGYLLAQLTRRCLEQPALAPLVGRASARLEAAYRVEMPQVPARNVAFYFAATLAQKLWMSARQDRGILARSALGALERI